MSGIAQVAGVEGGCAPPRVQLLPLLSELTIVTKERGRVRLGDVLNYAQLELIRECENQLTDKGRIRIITLKARQIGISTVIEAILFQLSVLLTDFQSLVVSHEKDSAEHILAITKRYWETYPFKEYHDEKYNGRNHLSWADNGSGMQIATAKNTDAGRSKTIQALHASEVAFYDDAPTLMMALRNAIPQTGLTAIFLESTANGIGNYFHETWQGAVKEENEFTPLFFPWHLHPQYTADFVADAAAATLGKLDEEEKQLRAKGIGDNRLLWRRWAIKNLSGGSIDSFHQEYPSNPNEAFLVTGRNVFPLLSLLAHYAPEFGETGELIRRGGRYVFVPSPMGHLTVYRRPTHDDLSWGIYQVGGDPTHTNAGDYSCAQVINRRTLEQVAVFRRKVDPVAFASDLFAIGTYYNDAIVAPEKEGPGYATVGALLTMGYTNVYESEKFDTTPGKIVNDTYGWSTNKQTKHVAVQNMVHALSEPLVSIGRATYGLLIHDEATFMEMQHYVASETGTGYHNADGSEYDDGVMGLCIAVTTHFLGDPLPPYTGPTSDEARPATRPAPPIPNPATGKVEYAVNSGPTADAPVRPAPPLTSGAKAHIQRYGETLAAAAEDTPQEDIPVPWEDWDEA